MGTKNVTDTTTDLCCPDHDEWIGDNTVFLWTNDPERLGKKFGGSYHPCSGYDECGFAADASLKKVNYREHEWDPDLGVWIPVAAIPEEPTEQ